MPRRAVAVFLTLLKLGRDANATITRTKVAKLLYLADLAAVKDGVEPITGIEWKWLNHGPFDYDLKELENVLVHTDVISRRPYWLQGWELRLQGDVPAGFDMPPADLVILERTVAKYGQLAAGTLKDLSYQTAPMLAAQKIGRGVVLNLELARPTPSIRKTAQRLTAALRGLPESETEDGAADEVVREIETLSPGRSRANGVFLTDE